MPGSKLCVLLELFVYVSPLDNFSIISCCLLPGIMSDTCINVPKDAFGIELYCEFLLVNRYILGLADRCQWQLFSQSCIKFVIDALREREGSSDPRSLTLVLFQLSKLSSLSNKPLVWNARIHAFVECWDLHFKECKNRKQKKKNPENKVSQGVPEVWFGLVRFGLNVFGRRVKTVDDLLTFWCLLLCCCWFNVTTCRKSSRQHSYVEKYPVWRPIQWVI